MRKRYTIRIKDRVIELGVRTCVMGILNVTPDSFSDGGKFLDAGKAVEHALKMVEDGADIIDIGGESTRPGAEPVSPEEELRRTIPVIKAIRKRSAIPISIDTYKSDVAREALNAGADIINDISACRFDAKMPLLAAGCGAPVVIMHIKGTPKEMQKNPEYKDVIGEIKNYLARSIAALVNAGVAREQIIIDPGIGFGKTVEHNLEIMRRLDEFASLDRPILTGVSRKSVIRHFTPPAPAEMILIGTAAAVAGNIMKGAHIVRVHDTAEIRQVAKIIDATFYEASR